VTQTYAVLKFPHKHALKASTTLTKLQGVKINQSKFFTKVSRYDKCMRSGGCTLKKEPLDVSMFILHSIYPSLVRSLECRPHTCVDLWYPDHEIHQLPWSPAFWKQARVSEQGLTDHTQKKKIHVKAWPRKQLKRFKKGFNHKCPTPK
jgi:hypothetical protein